VTQIRTDLAVESRSALGTDTIAGVESHERVVRGFPITTVRVTDTAGADAVGKPVGEYVTVELDGYLARNGASFDDGARVIADVIAHMLDIDDMQSVLVAGLGNAAITADAIGTAALRHTMVTAHLVESSPQQYGFFRKVWAVSTGVLGSTGVESARTLAAITRELRPDRVIVVDALATRSLRRICRTVQCCDTGIVPGSGVGNARAAINRETLGVPVIALGVPTVVDAGTLAADILERAGANCDTDFNLGGLESYGEGLVVTPREIDGAVNDIAKLVGYGINLALHKGLTVNDVNMFVG
jgi:spore protease